MSNFYQKLCDAIGAASVREQEPMSAHTTFRAGGPARYFVTPEGEKELAAVLAACREAEKAYYILGNGSNLLVSDAGYPGVMILLGSQLQRWSVQRANRASMSWAPVCCFRVPPGRRRKME